MRFETLPQWLEWQENLHFTEVDPGLDRIAQVYKRLIQSPLPFTVISVAGTNGKGSSVAMLESILRAAGYRTGTYTSPHLLRYNERICIDGIPCEDQIICQEFEQIDAARQDISLTYFEFGTLAAITLFKQQNIDIAIMEVGMGGRLDATNILDADIALITPVSLDHTMWLGDNREKIGREKAGILRQYHPLVCSEKTPPNSVLAIADELSVPVHQSGKSFNWTDDSQDWSWNNDDIQWEHLAKPALEGRYQLQNAAAVLQVIALLNQQQFDISRTAVETGLQQVKLLGRFQRVSGEIETIYDVTHNAQGAENLAALLSNTPIAGRTIAVMGMVNDKDISAVVTPLNKLISNWFIGGIEGSRGMPSEILAQHVRENTSARVNEYQTVTKAYQAAIQEANKDDRLLIFGSFHTVEEVMKLNQES